MTTIPLDDARLPPLVGGWRRETIDIGWTQVEMALPADPDSLLGDESVLEANRQDDYMPYWASLWPAATHMASLLEDADWAACTQILELGSGLGLVGIAGLLRGWNVRMSDYEPQAIAAAEYNAELNGFTSIETTILDWREPHQETYPVVLACDVLYEVRNHAPLLGLLKPMLTPDGCCWIGDPGRTPVIDFHHAATEAGFNLIIRSDTGAVQPFPVRGQFQLLELTRPSAAE